MDTQIGRFQIEQEIGRGGMGIVYRAYDPVLDRPIALKLLAPHLGTDEKALARFHREAALVSSLKHANIALVYDFGEHEGRPYIAMEWVKGRTLKAILQEEGRLPLDRSLRIFDQLASALDYAHRHGVIHRDLKPANILIDDKDQATIVDFGLAWLEDAPSLTMTGTILGTPLYMSPEQIQGQSLDGRSDLYSLAVILYEMLAGRTPFGGDETGTPVVIQQQLYAPPPPISEFNPTLPQQVERALAVGLSKEPESRFAAAATFAQALRDPQQALPAPAKASAKKRRWPRLALVALASMLALTLVVVVGIWRQDAITQEGGSIGSVDDDTPYSEPNGADWALANGSYHQDRYIDSRFYPLDDAPRWETWAEAWFSTPAVAAGGLIFAADGGRVRAFDWTTGEPSGEPPQLGAEIAIPLALYDDGETLLVFVGTADEQLYALNGWDAGLLWRIRSDELGGPLAGMTVGPDGRLYVTTVSGQVLVIDLYSSEIYFTLNPIPKAEFSQAPAVTSTALYLVTTAGQLLAIDPATQDVAWVAEVNGAPTTSPLVAENWGQIVVGTEEGVVRSYSALTGNPTWEAAAKAPVTGLAADWLHLYVATEAGDLLAFDGANGEFAWSRDLGEAPALPPLTNGEQVVGATATGRIRTIMAENGGKAAGPNLDLDLPLHHPPAIVGGWLVVQSEDGLHVFGP
jgi:serine/threonine protein kinase/outer membrane protein assembly factor BamB